MSFNFGPDMEEIIDAFTVESCGDCSRDEAVKIPIGIYEPMVLWGIAAPLLTIEGTDHSRGVDFKTRPMRGYIRMAINGLPYGRIDFYALANHWLDLKPSQLLLLPDKKFEIWLVVEESCREFNVAFSFRVTKFRKIGGGHG